MDKAEILDAIRRCAEENGGAAVGRERFTELTGITEGQWSGRYWTRWSDAVAEAGFEPNTMNEAIPDDVVLGALASLASELGRYPTVAEMKMRHRTDLSFPSATVFGRFGTKSDVIERLALFAESDPALEAVRLICEPLRRANEGGSSTTTATVLGRSISSSLGATTRSAEATQPAAVRMSSRSSCRSGWRSST